MSEIAQLVDQVERLGMAGLYFTYSGLFRNGYATLPSDPVYDPLWRDGGATGSAGVLGASRQLASWQLRR